MTVAERVQMSDPGKASPTQWGVGGVPLAGGSWIVEHSGGTVEAEASHGQVTEFDYSAFAVHNRWQYKPTETGYLARDMVTGIFGFGAGVNEAIVDLVSALSEHRDVLASQDALSPDLQEQLKYLRALF